MNFFISNLMYLMTIASVSSSLRKEMVMYEEILEKNSSYKCKTWKCGENASCKSVDDSRYCECTCGFAGDPYKKCEVIDKNKSIRIQFGLAISITFREAKLNDRLDFAKLLLSSKERQIENGKLQKYSKYILYSSGLMFE